MKLWLEATALVLLGIAAAVLGYRGLAYVANDDALSRDFLLVTAGLFVVAIFVGTVWSVRDWLAREREREAGR